MKLSDQKPGTILTIKDVPQNDPCENCSYCLRIRLMEMGFLPNTRISVEKRNQGLWLLNIINENDSIEQTIALRDDEAERILFHDSECSFQLSED